jgi:succinate-semialdehyde dehydrogenase/glutarate-semialdehyde dehydrogenase
LAKLTLELGGNSPFIVFDDAKLETAVESCIMAKFRNSGQTCVTANRIFVQKGIYEQFAGALVSFLLAFLSRGGSLMLTSSFYVSDKES